MLRHIFFFAIVFQLAEASDPSWADLLLDARELHTAGAHVAAEEGYLAAAKEAKRLGHETGKARIWKELACLHQDLGKARQAEALLLQAISVLKALNEPPALEIASLKHYLAVGYRLQERFEEAEQLHREVLREREQALGPNHSEVGASLHALGMVYVENGRLQESVTVLVTMERPTADSQ
jgi:tetratricopeptide (TPR) repeat protein